MADGDRLNVLVADDNPSARAQVAAILGELGHDVVTVADGPEAVAALAALQFDLMVLDFDMPAPGGADIAREHASRAPVIGLSSAGASRQEWGDAPLTGWLKKPVDARHLAKLVQELDADDVAGAEDETPVDLAHLAAYTGGDRDLERELAVLFAASCDRYLREMRESADDRSWREAAHGLKGAARGIGANEVGRMAAFSETLLGDAARPKRADILNQLEAAAARVRTFFEGHLEMDLG
ncbi:MAG: response regulator [Minwuia sp.]|uniref:Hpt domain-containing response regulator n=1 Tax=Minwuia sp. TaxID=2493630 RepID=UPI003A85EA75